MLSEESYASDERFRRGSESSNGVSSSGETIAPNDVLLPTQYLSSSSPVLGTVKEELDRDIAEAIRLSFREESASLAYSSSSSSAAKITFSSVPIKYSEAVTSPPSPPALVEGSHRSVVDDLEFALRLSLEEEQNRGARIASMEDEFPALGSASGSPSRSKKGRKGKVRCCSEL